MNAEIEALQERARRWTRRFGCGQALRGGPSRFGSLKATLPRCQYMRWTSWLLALAGIAQYAIIVLSDKADYVSKDFAYLVMWLTIIASVIAWWCCGWCGSCCGYGGGCGCNHCEGCKGDDCCGKCDCCEGGSHGHEQAHEGHSH